VPYIVVNVVVIQEWFAHWGGVAPGPENRDTGQRLGNVLYERPGHTGGAPALAAAGNENRNTRNLQMLTPFCESIATCNMSRKEKGFLSGEVTKEKLLELYEIQGTVALTVGGGELLGAGVVAARAARGTTTVYQSVEQGVTRYVGITDDLARRAGEQLRGKGISIDAIPGLGNLSRADARAVEQVLIEHHGLARNGGTLINRINSIAESNPIYGESLRRGQELLRQAGYPGF
jgi:hypothetical protein